VLTLVPTPIGNLEDISLRSIKTLEKASIFFCEDTRVTKRLLSLLSDKFNYTFNPKQFISIHSHNEKEYLEKHSDEFIELVQNQECVYMSDAGMPCISDPASLLVDFCIEHKLPYEVLSGANAVLVGFAMSGFEAKEFTFYGFLAHKSSTRVAELHKILSSDYVNILYESPLRIAKLIDEICEIAPQRTLFIAKELTKKFQQSYKGSATNLKEKLKTINTKGEWVVVIEPSSNKYSDNGEAITLQDLEELQIKPKAKAKLIAKLTGRDVKSVYDGLAK
jgi:16S rRNA (cytidine1402-2'-O)-methyltransferase